MSKRLANQKDERMTVKEVAEALGCKPEAVKKHIRVLFPNLMLARRTTYLTAAQVTAVLERMKKGQAYAHHVTGGNVAAYNSGVASAETADTLYLQVAVKEREAKALWRRIAEQEKTRADTAEMERDLERQSHYQTKRLLAEQMTGTAMYQRIAESGGLVKSDRDDLLDTYQRNTKRGKKING